MLCAPVRGWIVRRRFWQYVNLRWQAEKRRIRAETRHIIDVCAEARSTILDFFKSERGKKQVQRSRFLYFSTALFCTMRPVAA